MEKIIKNIRSFRDDTSGGLSVEACLMMPMLIWAYAGMIVFWDAYKNDLIMEKATYTVADTISRERVPIVQSDLDGLNQAFAWLTYTDLETAVRVSVVENTLDSSGNPDLVFRWSRSTGSKLPPYNSISQVRKYVPLIGIGEDVIIVETYMKYEPMITGLQWTGNGSFDEGFEMQKRRVVIPRFGTNVCWQTCEGRT